ncbi:F390 synthetase-related protein [Bacillus cereus group sp. TH152-1LC]|uniref:F390 synthetase-related protein n=1 Tax=Bacillus cereus group sp. TH152-1LC TaxID=3018060 RepID=UPI0022E8F71D|nr:F390 synthetase-related protein [Bacillus cereus group sp. TH152-1LC]MDA1675160.1 adenylate cyclase [Bacillus cereus group sp. TH152-1LC]
MNKLSILKQYVKTKYGNRLKTKEQLQKFQNAKIEKHIAFVLQHSPFYNSLYGEFSQETKEKQWSSLPIIDKQTMMDNFDLLNTVKISKKEAFEVAIEAESTRDFTPTINNVTIGLSSGTSGNRGIFLVSEEERYLWAGSTLAKVLPSSILGKHTVAFFLRANSNLYETTQNKRISFHFFDLLDEFQNHIKRLNETQPSIIIAPPSLLRKIAEWKNEGLIQISPIKIVSVAEVLEDIDKEFIQSTFNQIVHQVYQCTEGFLATTCAHGTLHINEDLVYIEKEYLDKENGVFVPIITDFSRKTQPIIRYRLNDILIEKKQPCRCNSPFLALERIDGRCDDMFFGFKKDSNETITIFPDFIRRAVMLASEEIQEFKVIQHADSNIEVKLKCSDNDRQQIQNNIQRELSNLWVYKNCNVPSIRFSEYNIKPSDKKLKRIENLHK